MTAVHQAGARAKGAAHLRRHGVPRAVTALAACGALACAAAPPGAPGASPSAAGLPSAREERVLVPAFGIIPAVAASPHRVYIASPYGIAALDRDFDRWLLPATRLDGYPGGDVTAMAVDPVEEGAWVAAGGALAYWRPELDQLTVTPLPGIVDRIAFDRRDPGSGAWVHAAGGWALASRMGTLTPAGLTAVPPPAMLVESAGLAAVWARWPSLQAAQSLLTRDAALHIWPVLSGTQTPNVSEVWLGTAGGGLFRVDPVALTGTQIPFGPLETGTAAVAVGDGGVWMAGAGRGLVGGLAFASADLQQWRWLNGALAARLAGARARRLAVAGSDAWLATDRGLVLLDTRDASRVLVWTMGNGLPADQALSVAAAPGGAWIGTTRGLVFVRDAGTARAASPTAVSTPVVRDVAVRSLLLAGDTLWIGSDAGLLLLRGASPDSAPRRVAIADARLRRPIVALARSDSLVAAATPTDVVLLDPRAAIVSRAYAALDPAPVQGIAAMAMDARSIWLAGPGGVLVVARAGGASRFLPAPSVVPGGGYDVALDPTFAWVATPGGLLRLARLPDGSVR